MATAGNIGYGTTFTWHGTLVGELTRIGSMELTLGKVEASTLSSPDEYREYVAGMIDPGEIALEGWFDPDDAGQIKLLDDLNDRTKQTWLITFPAGVSGATFTGTGLCVAFGAGDATPEGMVPFTATIAITTKPTVTP